MDAALSSSGPEKVRNCRASLASGRQKLKEKYLAGGSQAALLRGAANLVDQVLCQLWNDLAIDRHLALAAVGGYGRGELYPASDVDLLILLPDQESGVYAPALEELNQIKNKKENIL